MSCWLLPVVAVIARWGEDARLGSTGGVRHIERLFVKHRHTAGGAGYLYYLRKIRSHSRWQRRSSARRFNEGERVLRSAGASVRAEQYGSLRRSHQSEYSNRL